MADNRFICINGGIREMTDEQASHEETKEKVHDKILALFIENGITVIEAEFIMRKIVEGAACKAKHETTFSQLYGDS